MKIKKTIWRKIQQVAKGLLECCIVFVGGGILVLFLLWLGLALILPLFYNSVDVTSPESQGVALSVLHECNLGESRFKKVNHGYKSMSDFHGDHFGAYAIEISHIHISELTPERGWTRGDQMSGDMQHMIRNRLGEARSKNLKWFPSDSEVKSSDVFVRSLPDNTFSLILIRLSDKMLFYSYFQT